MKFGLFYKMHNNSANIIDESEDEVGMSPCRGTFLFFGRTPMGCLGWCDCLGSLPYSHFRHNRDIPVLSRGDVPILAFGSDNIHYAYLGHQKIHKSRPLPRAIINSGCPLLCIISIHV